MRDQTTQTDAGRQNLLQGRPRAQSPTSILPKGLLLSPLLLRAFPKEKQLPNVCIGLHGLQKDFLNTSHLVS